MRLIGLQLNIYLFKSDIADSSNKVVCHELDHKEIIDSSCSNTPNMDIHELLQVVIICSSSTHTERQLIISLL